MYWPSVGDVMWMLGDALAAAGSVSSALSSAASSGKVLREADKEKAPG